mmetsp:Transcript_12105/g.22639  ORF Transcript_12105/g.22639 Transcript_12105/m.22639 type:complete len:238 (+) Transcript_12105:3-716(+)
MAGNLLTPGLVDEAEIKEHKELLGRVNSMIDARVKDEVKRALLEYMGGPTPEGGLRRELDLMRRDLDHLRRDVETGGGKKPEMQAVAVQGTANMEAEMLRLSQTVSTLQEVMEASQLRHRLQFVAAGMLALTASDLDKPEKMTSMRALEEEEASVQRHLTRLTQERPAVAAYERAAGNIMPAGMPPPNSPYPGQTNPAIAPRGLSQQQLALATNQQDPEVAPGKNSASQWWGWWQHK